MSHYAKVIGGKVIAVIRAEAEFFNKFVDDSPGSWILTSYNTRGGVHYASNSHDPDGGLALRGNFASVGHTYDSANDVFYPPQPYPSWTISAPSWTWAAPSPIPATGGPYSWNETLKSWMASTAAG